MEENTHVYLTFIPRGQHVYNMLPIGASVVKPA